MIGHDDRTSQQYILSYFVLLVNKFCPVKFVKKMSDQKEDLKGHVECFHSRDQESVFEPKQKKMFA